MVKFVINITYMKKLFYYLLLLIPFLSVAQISTGSEAEFDYGIRNLAPQTVDNPNYLGTLGNDGTMGQIGSTDFLRGRVAQSDTGVLEFLGLSTNSATTINIGAAVGYVVNNETNPEDPTFTRVSYPGASNVTVTTVGTGVASYVMLSSAGVISFQNTFPTSAERKAKIWLGKVSHPLGAITLVVNEPDYITSPLAFSRDWAQDLGPYVNNGVYPYANGANLNINITGGTITGDGINFVTSKTDPNHLTMGAAIVANFTYRTQTGVGGATTSVTPAVYDVAGSVTAIPGSTNQATIQYFYVLPGIGYVAQLGQTIYPTFSAAVAALGKETFVRYPSFVGNVLPVAALVVTKGCTALNDTGVTAQFFRANKNGDFFGASAGTSTATIQSAYNNSVQPVVTTNSTLGAFTFKRGSAADTDNIIVGQNGAGTIKFALTGEGNATVNGINSPSFVQTGYIFSLATTGQQLFAASTNDLYFGNTSLPNTNFQSLTSVNVMCPKFTINTGVALFGTTTNNGVDRVQTVGSTTQTGQFKSTLATGTAPLSVASTTLNTNLNADLLDGLNSTAFALASYKSYVIDMTQSATSDPVANVVFENTVGAITLTRTGVGTYALNSSGLFTGSKTFVIISNNKYFVTSPVFLAGSRTSNNVVELTSYVGTTLTDNVFNQAQIELRVYN